MLNEEALTPKRTRLVVPDLAVRFAVAAVSLLLCYVFVSDAVEHSGNYRHFIQSTANDPLLRGADDFTMFYAGAQLISSPAEARPTIVRSRRRLCVRT
jgi:hypothetical protein